MAIPVPRLSLSRGQVAWILAGGQAPEPFILTQLRYFKQINIPFADGDQDKGRGNRVVYTFYDLMDVGVAFEAVRRGVAARLLKEVVARRSDLRKVYRTCYRDIPAAAYEASWIRSRGEEIPLFQNDYYVSIDSRFAKRPGDTDILAPDDVPRGNAADDFFERLFAEPHKVVISLKRLMIPLLVYAAEAPIIPTGPKS